MTYVKVRFASRDQQERRFPGEPWMGEDAAAAGETWRKTAERLYNRALGLRARDRRHLAACTRHGEGVYTGQMNCRVPGGTSLDSTVVIHVYEGDA